MTTARKTASLLPVAQWPQGASMGRPRGSSSPSAGGRSVTGAIHQPPVPGTAQPSTPSSPDVGPCIPATGAPAITPVRPLPRAADRRLVLAVDGSPRLRPDANTCADRAYAAAGARPSSTSTHVITDRDRRPQPHGTSAAPVPARWSMSWPEPRCLLFLDGWSGWPSASPTLPADLSAYTYGDAIQ